MRTITTLAAGRIKYNRSRTILTAVAIMLTTMLLMTIGTSAVGLLDMNRQEAAAEGNVHAVFYNRLNQKQVEMLTNHMDVEAVEINEIFATVEYGKMNGFLTCRKTLKEGIYHHVGNIIEGHEAYGADEICGPAAFFERMDVEPVIGNKITISFRPYGEGMIETREFTICGLVSQLDGSVLDISDSRINYSASVSEALVAEYLAADEREYGASIRVLGEDELNYDEITAKIKTVAENIGYDTKNINFNNRYLYTMTEPDNETIQIVGVIALCIIVFSGLVIYSIYYVSVITDVQEIGKLKALGASKGQIKRLLLTEGMRIAAFAVPAGLILGYLLPYFALPVVINHIIEGSLSAVKLEKLHMFSLPVLLLVAVAVLLVIYLSLLKPMKMAAKISPVEAIRYQEESGGKKVRRGNRSVNVFRLSAANLMRNKKRTIVTMMTMGLSCVLFMCLAGVLSSMRVEDIARRNIEKGDFRLHLEYSANDKEYPENNLDSLQQCNIFNEELLGSIESIDGVEAIGRQGRVLIGSGYPSELFEDDGRVSMSCMDREQMEAYQKEVKRGQIDYDTMVAEYGVVFTNDTAFEVYGFAIGDTVPLTVYDGSRQLDISLKIMATVNDGFAPYFVIPKEVWDALELEFDSTTDLLISVSQDKYDSVKASLQDISDSFPYFILYSMDEEMEIGAMAVALVKYPVYVILIMIAVISFMNLINTMITSIVTRKRELGVLQAVGLSDRQLLRMLAGEGMVFTVGALLASVTLGNLLGYLMYLWAKENKFMDLSMYHYPFLETILLALVLIVGQLGITYFISKRVRKESLIDRIRSGE